MSAKQTKFSGKPVTAPKATFSMPLKSALKKTSKPAASSNSASTSTKADGSTNKSFASDKGKKRRHDDEEEEDHPDLDGDSNVSGFSDVEERDLDIDMNDEFDLEGVEVEETAEVEAGAEAEEEEEDEELDTEDEIDAAYTTKKPKSKKNTKKNKAPTTADTFGTTLQALLAEGEDEDDNMGSSSDDESDEGEAGAESTEGAAARPAKKLRRAGSTSASVNSRATTARTHLLATNPILALSQKALPPSAAKVSLERKAKRVLKVQKMEKQDRARIRNVLEGWGPRIEAGVPGGQEWERGLRKVAQRGVVKLFNAINQAASSHPTLTGSAAVNNERQSKKEKDNVLGRGGRQERLTKEGFLDMIKSGGK